MPTLDYTPKHKRPEGWGGSTPRGPERWGRAAHNALTNPLSPAAKLFADRFIVAREFADFEEAGEIFEHRDVTYALGDSDEVISSKRKYLTCNMVCAAMQIQLDFGVKRYDQVLAVFEQNYRRTYVWAGEEHKTQYQTNVSTLDPRAVKRAVRCQVCGTGIRPKRRARR